MKRRLALLSLLLVALPACAGGHAPPPDAPDVYYESSVPLRARLVDAAGGLAIQMNRPAHVAIFEVVPGRGMGLMYPAYGSDRSHFAGGFFRVPRDHLRPYTWHYASDPGYSAATGPRYYLLVASRAPLWVDRFQDAPGAVREWFGLRRFAALDPRPAMDELVETVVPPQADEDWDTDLLTLWPQDARSRFDDRRRVRVVCGNGVVVTTTWESAHVACRFFNNRPSGEQGPPQRPDTVQAPSDSVQVPTRRRPEPRSTDDAASADGLRRPHARPVEHDEADTHVVRRVPPRAEDTEDDERPETRERDRDPLRGRYEAPRRRPEAMEPGGRESRPVASPGSEQTSPRGKTPRSETPRSETPRTPAPRREPPQRSEPARPAAQPEPARAETPRAVAPAPAARERGGDPR